MAVKKVCIVGAGPSGLVAIKSCLEEGLEPYCFEQHEKIGGRWYYTDDLRPHQGDRTYNFSLTTYSKEMMCFSDFPFPKDAPPFPTHHVAHKYLQQYAQKYNLRKCIQLNTRVGHIRKTEDHELTGRYEVEIETSDWRVSSHVFDAVILCTGFRDLPFAPEVEGQDSFSGVISHCQTFTTGDLYQGRRVVVVGDTDTAADISCALCPYASQIYISIGEGCWLLSAMGKGGVPFDFQKRRALQKMPNILIENRLSSVADETIDHKKYGLHPSGSCSKPNFVISEQLKMKIATGVVKVVSGIKKMTAFDIELTDGSTLSDIDSIIFCTGYKENFCILESSIRKQVQPKENVYKMVIPKEKEPKTFAFVGRKYVNHRSYWPTIELQARLAAMTLSGNHRIHDSNEELSSYTSLNNMITELSYQDSIAKELGVDPDFSNLCSKSLKLALSSYFGPAFPAQYRLRGPHKWDGAEEACLTAQENTFSGTQNRDMKLSFLQDNYYLLSTALVAICSMFLFYVAIL